ALSSYLKLHGHQVRASHIEGRFDFLRLKRTLREFSPEVVGISINSTEARHIPTFIETAKRWNPRVPVVLGGHYPTLAPEDSINYQGVDAVCVGEGEEAFIEYLQSLQEGGSNYEIENLWFRRNGEVIANPSRAFIEDLDGLPYMDREAVNFQRIIDVNGKTLITVVGRGFCPYNCTFCANSAFAKAGRGRWVRRRSVDNVLDEFQMLGNRYNFKSINFGDDNFCNDREWLLEFCEKYSRRFSWAIDCFGRCDSMDDETTRALARAGCRHIFIGLESGNDYIRNEVLKKNISNEQVVEAAEKLNRVGIKAVVSCMIGLPFETPEAFQDTIEVCRRIHKNQLILSSAFGAAPKILIYNPFPNTRLYSLCKEKGWLREAPKVWRIFRETYLDMPQFPRREIYRLHRTFRYQVYKDSYPLYAWLFRLYDLRIARLVSENLPGGLFSRIHNLVSDISRMIKPKNIAEGFLRRTN
ncbi:MAG: radical SAM protein, partial [bacterium]